jgi:hypothetical protein
LTAIGRAMPLLTGDFTREELVLKLAAAGPGFAADGLAAGFAVTGTLSCCVTTQMAPMAG